jgi:hypothetical protein
MKVLTRSRILMTALLFPIACSSGGSSGTGTGGSSATGGSGPGTGGSSTGGSPATGGSSTGGSSSSTGGKGGSATGGVIGTGGSATGGSGGHATGGSGTGGSSTGGTGGSSSGTGGTVTTADQNVLERNKNPSRDGNFLQPTITKAMAMAMAADTNFNTAATFTSTVSNGTNMMASPVYLDAPSGGGLFFIPDGGGDVVARKEDGTSAWTTNVGAPATGGIGCSGFATTPPLGILSTPAIDATSKTIYVAGIVGSGSGITNQIASAIDITTGKVKSGWPVKVDMLASFDPVLHNQRSALSLVNGILYIPYAGFVGDCGNYHGRVVSINTSTPTTAGQWAAGDMGDGIWASGGLASDGTSIFTSTGNQTPLDGTFSSHMDSESVVRITGMGTKADSFSPSTDWANFDHTDADLDANNPILITVPGATPSKMIAAISKGGSVYLLDPAKLSGGSLLTPTFTVSNSSSVYGAPASYQTAKGTYIVITSSKPTGCPMSSGSGAVMGILISGSPLKASVAWCAANASSTNPIATTSDGTSDAIVWYMSNSKLMGVDGDTGATVYSSTNTCSGIPHWSSPIAVKGRIVVAGTGKLCAWGIPGSLSLAPQPAVEKRRHKRKIASAAPTRL